MHVQNFKTLRLKKKILLSPILDFFKKWNKKKQLQHNTIQLKGKWDKD